MTEEPEGTAGADGERPSADCDPATEPSVGGAPEPAGLRDPVDTSFEAPGEPEREKREVGGARRRTRRRAARSGTNPTAEDLPDVVPPREPPPPGEAAHDRWLREQRPPHWE
ncbi:hypothetical protein [Oryzobacter terrae]|uniref:hypothetical protein n=1 Tax=Oryzobacter terrae TaxID=1620385 RepID=UPI00366DA7A9